MDEFLPLEVQGDPIQYQINRTSNGWVIELINNAGVVKKPAQPPKLDPTAIARVVLRPRIHADLAREWKTGRSYSRPDEVRLEVGPGQNLLVEFKCP
ncbi:MAG TPA: hypothetical protein VL361_22825 [Candidatus Limnocylindrales bacterium]|nr:hypothetical protein [Candidatus Limnocylindrales bacterium]